MKNIAKEVRRRNLEYINSNLNNTEEICSAYYKDIKRSAGGMSRYFWAQFLPIFINLIIFMFIVFIFSFYVKSYLFLFGMSILSIYAAFKNYFGFEKKLLMKIIELNLKRDNYAYFDLLADNYLKRSVDQDLYDQILSRVNKEDLISISSSGIITNFEILKKFEEWDSF